MDGGSARASSESVGEAAMSIGSITAVPDGTGGDAGGGVPAASISLGIREARIDSEGSGTRSCWCGCGSIETAISSTLGSRDHVADECANKLCGTVNARREGT